MVEIDGSSHDGRQEYDALRTKMFDEAGIRVVRFQNEEVHLEIKLVLDRLKSFLAE